MGKGRQSGGKAEVTEYRMSVHFGVALELDSVNAFWVDDKLAWRGSAHVNTAIPINLPDLFGGPKKEGGLVGTVQVLLGRPDQVLPIAVASRYGLTPETCPAFRGLTTLMFHGSGVVAGPNRQQLFTDAFYGAGVANNQGFTWKWNTPIIAQKVQVEGTRAPKGLLLEDALIGPDANPAHIIYECLTNDEWGMGGAPELIDAASFSAAGVTFKNEGLGMSFVWLRQTDIESMVREVIDHVQATLYVNPNTGLLSIKALRDDYDFADLREITPLNATLSNFKRRSLGEIINEISVTFTNPETEQEETVTAQDIASIQSQGGQKVAGSRNFYGFRNRDIATKVLARELRASTAPLVSADVRLDRSAWDLLPGEVVKMSWPRRSVNQIVMRVGRVNYGKPRDSSIRASLLQDVFSLARPPIKISPGTDFVDPARPPAPLTMQIFTLPSFFVRNGSLQIAPIDLVEPEVLVGVLADSLSEDTLTYELVSDTVGAAGETFPSSKGALSLTPLQYLLAALPQQAQSILPAAVFPNPNEAPVVGGFIFIGYDDADQEIALVSEQTATGWRIERGVLDTVPRAWAIGTPVWSVNPGARIVDTTTLHAAGATVTYRGLDRTALGILPYAEAPVETQTLTNRPHLPLRPANVQINGVASGGTSDVSGGTSDVSTLSDIAVTWATRNRYLEDTQVLHWTDGPVQPEYRQRTIVEVRVPGGAVIRSYVHLWTATEIVLPKAWFAQWASVEVRVYAEREGLVSLNRATFTVSGLANNPAAPPPPLAPEEGIAPSYTPTPSPGVFGATGGAISTEEVLGDEESTQSVPVLLVSVDAPARRYDYPEARGFIARYQSVTVTPPLVEGEPETVTRGPWLSGPSVDLNDYDITWPITSVAPNTTYEIEVAYVSPEGIPGGFLSLGEHTTSDLVALSSEESAALERIAIIDSDGWLSRGEKSEIILQSTTINSEYAGIAAQAADLGVTTELTAYGTAVVAMNDYLASLVPAWDDVETDTPIDGPAFRAIFTAAYTTRRALLTAVTGGLAATVAAALATLEVISSDSWLSAGEKPEVLRQWTTINAEQAGLVAQAIAIGGAADELSDYQAAVTALNSYLAALSPAWNDLNVDTPIVGNTFRARFSDCYVTKQALLDAMYGTLGSGASAAAARLDRIASDSWLTAGEKPDIVRQHGQITGEYAGILAQLTAFGLTSTATSYTTAYNALLSYLGGLSPAWDSLTTDTPIVGTTFRTRFNSYYVAREVGRTAIAAQLDSEISGISTELTIITSDNWLSKGEKPILIREHATLNNDYAGLATRAANLGVTTELTAHGSAVNAMNIYLGGLSPAWNNLTTDTPIVGATLRGFLSEAYASKQALMNAFTAVLDANADAALADLGIIASDNWLSRAEKPEVVRQHTLINNEYGPLSTQAIALNVDPVPWANKIIALNNYLSGLSPAWNNLSVDTPINGTTLRTMFNDVFSFKTQVQTGMAAALQGTGARRPVGRSVSFPTSSTANSISVSAHNVFFESGVPASISLPGTTIGGLSAGTTYGIFYRASSGYQVEAQPATSRMTTGSWIFVGWQTTALSGGDYPTPPPPPGGSGGTGDYPVFTMYADGPPL